MNFFTTFLLILLVIPIAFMISTVVGIMLQFSTRTTW